MGTLIRNAKVEAQSTASVEEVWAIVADVTRTGEWSHECKHVELLDGAIDTRPGTRFGGRNICGRSKWSRVNEVLALDAPNELAWRTVPTRVFRDSTIWRIRVEPAADGGSTIIQSYDVVKLGPVLDRLFWLLVPAHRDRRPALAEDMRRLGEVAARPLAVVEG
jgi:polyketide cyclase/dehydrase/lipid transport protein